MARIGFVTVAPASVRPIALVEGFRLCRSRALISRVRPRRAKVLQMGHQESSPSPEEVPAEEQKRGGFFGWLRKSSQRRTSMGAVLRVYGLAAVISYGLFDACTYSISLLLAMRGYIAAGKVITAKTLPQVLAIMWGINNFSRPFRVAGALALAPVVDAKFLKPLFAFLGKAPSSGADVSAATVTVESVESVPVVEQK